MVTSLEPHELIPASYRILLTHPIGFVDTTIHLFTYQIYPVTIADFSFVTCLSNMRLLCFPFGLIEISPKPVGFAVLLLLMCVELLSSDVK
jgi:hypothetical protein